MDSDAGDIEGLPVEQAVETLVDADPSRDPEQVTQALYHLTNGEGVVTKAEVEGTERELSKLVATAESRVEFAHHALDDAREAAAPVADIDTVAARLDSYTVLVEALDPRAESLAEHLREVVTRDPDDLYAVATGIYEVTARARELQMDADDLQFELEDFERWLDSPDHRHRSLEEEVAAVAESFDTLTDEADAVEAGEGDQLARRWADTTLRHRTTTLLLEDCRAELADLRDWPDVRDDHLADLASLAERIDRIERNAATLGDQLTRMATEAWQAEYGDDLRAFEAALDDLEAPVDWGAVQDAYDRYQP